ncbi:MAG TPA: glycosyltransferase family 2 protein [Dissulfurispiraceae bacterium]|nr:glycosyltransferase family 2 protein [Dissulfurispiraceae bacterium]
MDRKIPISVAIVTKNEEKNIRDALESIRDFEDIVVVDAFSEDRTVEISRTYTERIYQHEWSGYSAQKQRAVDYTRGEWVLILDADERVTPGLKSEMVEGIAASRFSGFYLPRRNYFLGTWIRYSGWWPDYTLRLFRKTVSRVEPREVHEKVAVMGPVGYLREPLEHYSYRSLSEYIGKMEIYSALAAKELCTRRPTSLIRSMVLNPPLVFLKMFLLRQGFRDGTHGFLLAVLYGSYTFLKYAKAWEARSAPK